MRPDPNQFVAHKHMFRADEVKMMSTPPENTTPSSSASTPARDEAAWARPVAALRVREVPAGAVNLNVDGRGVAGPLQGFGPLWQKTYRIRLEGVNVRPTEVIALWKEHFSELQPPQNRFYPSLSGLQPGEIVLLNATVGGIPIDAAMMVLYADDESFTLMTPQGLPEAGWIMSSAYEDDGVTVAQIVTQGRSADPIYEMGFRVVGARAQERIWVHVLTHLAASYGVSGPVSVERVCLDPHIQWRRAGNVFINAGVRTVFYLMLVPLRAVVRYGAIRRQADRNSP